MVKGEIRCFVATAVFGSPFADEVKTLSSFRDKVLLQNNIGRNLVTLYYRFSPHAADFVRDKPTLKFLVRLHLKPVTILIEKLGFSNLPGDRKTSLLSSAYESVCRRG